MVESENEALRLARLGDQASFAVLVRRYQPMVYNLAFACLGEADAAADAAQEAFLRAWRGLPSFAGQSSFSTWLYSIAHRTSLTMASHRRRMVPLAEIPEPMAGEDTDPLAVVLRHQETEQIRALLMQLPAPARTALVLYHFHSCSYEEIARITGEPIGTVRTRLHRGRAKLRSMLGAKGGDARCNAK